VGIVTAEAYAAIAETLPIGTVAVDPEIDTKGEQSDLAQGNLTDLRRRRG
jgi:hypothetical protein